MLRSTFLHLKGVGAKTEKSLWRQGITKWDQYPVDCDQFALLEELAPPSPLYASIEAYNNGDMAFFAKNLPSSAYYRAALEFPEETLFLDIETTGLSVYYDIVTLVGWSIGKSFGVHINGQDDTDLRIALKQAKVIVTFNGTMFDLKFLNKHYKSLDIPPLHIDLRFLSKRIGLSGGQKQIEELLGYKRDKDVEGMLGEAAPILWHKYRRGENDALKRLITYNHEDVEGMKTILDFCIEKRLAEDCVPDSIKPKYKFSSQLSELHWEQDAADGIAVHDFTGTSKPLIEFAQLDTIYPLQDFVVLGIDLVSSEERESGCCELRGNKAVTCRLKSDDEILELITSAKPNLVSIDSPLSIPSGRTSFFDDDPYREYGIMRDCERTLKRRGVNVYPSLIPSMQKLTRRGMTLAEKIRCIGIPVIESYPGAAQDIMSIPRKQHGLDYLVIGLNEFGITGDFVQTEVSHDELDAITSAIVGLFFWTGMFEGLGNPQEEYLIIPDLNGDYKTWLGRSIIGLTNPISLTPEDEAQFSDYEYHFVDFGEIELWLKARKELSERASSLAQEIGIPIDLRRKWLGKELVAGYSTKKKLIVKGVATLGDQTLMMESFGPAFRASKAKAYDELLSEIDPTA
jgi:uncharacterized protein YprB with RNaseH-like and TPR domain/predicted nuclease with RNAse H fold